jgi:1-deoxy-D-xylulose-5-phosphate reductoisomerase
MPAVLNAANEIAVEEFIKGRIGFVDMSHVVEETIDAHVPTEPTSVRDVLDADRWGRIKAAEIAERITINH